MSVLPKVAVAALAALSFLPSLAVEITARNYVQSGLIVHWDALENAGYGVHDGTTNVWKDLSPTGFDLKLDTATWETNALYSSGNLAAHGSSSLVYRSIEILFENKNNAVNAWLFGNGIDRYCVLASNRVQWMNNRAITTFNYTITGTHGLSWVDNTAAYLDGVSQTYSAYTDSWNIGMSYVVLGKRDTSYPFTGRYFVLRLYDRDLTAEEVAYNSAIDQIRFQGKTLTTVSLPNNWKMDVAGNLCDANDVILVVNPTLSFVWTGNAGTTDWHTAGNWAFADGSVAPIAPNGSPAAITGAVVAVSSSVSAKTLTLGDGAGLSVGAGAMFSAQVVMRGGSSVGRGIFSGDSTKGTAVDWVTGAGTVNVAGSADIKVPTLYPQPAADGWYEVGLKTGYDWGRAKGSQKSPDSNWHYIDAERPDWGSYAYPAGAKLRLVGGVLLDTVPDWFSEIDQSQIKLLFLNSQVAFANGTPLKIPSGVNFRYQPAVWVQEGNRFWLTSALTGDVTSDIEMNGTFNIRGDGTHLSVQTFTGRLSGSGGSFLLTNFGNQGRLRGAFDFTGSLGSSWQEGCALWVDTASVSGRFTSGTFGACGSKYGTNVSYSANGILFGCHDSSKTANRALRIDSLTGSASDVTDAPSKKRWRVGGHVIVWGGNTVSVGKLYKGIHVVARRQDQNCNNSYFGSASCKGNGNLAVDELASGCIYASTNIALTIGKMAASTSVDYTYQSGAINMLTLDITNSCDASTTVKATDLAMLPARLSGFAGKVKLTATATKTYPVTLDLSKGPDAVYNRGGCAGSGVLDSVPSAGTVNVTLTGATPVKGAYGIVRFSSGGEKLSGWQVSIAGHEGETRFMVGSGENAKIATLMRDDTGVWLKVTNPGLQVFLR